LEEERVRLEEEKAVAAAAELERVRLEEERVRLEEEKAVAAAAELERVRLEEERVRLEEEKAVAAAAELERARLEEEQKRVVAAAQLEQERLAAVELIKLQEKEKLELEEKIKQDKLTAEAAAVARAELAENQKQEKQKAENQKREAATRLTKIQYGWPEEFKDLPAIPVNDIKSYTDLIKLTINSDKDHNYNHELISAKDIGDEPLPSNLTYLPAGIFDKKLIDNSGAMYAALSAYKTILEKAKMKLFDNKITTDEIRRIADKSQTSDAELNQWIEQKINGRGGALDKAMKLIS
jgi:hypothetical protein